MDEKPGSVEEKIILATIGCIEQYGISGATNRQIAQAAGVNLAAINYYFRSKEVLIQRCMEITLKNAFDLSDFPAEPGASAQARCMAVLIHLIEGGFQYPGITRAHFYNVLAEGQPDLLLAEHVNRFVDILADDLRGRGCSLPLAALKLALIQMLSSVFLTVLAPSLFAEHPGADLHDPAACQVYVTRLVQGLLPEC